jgi:drug/metabolite transporter (DMT)-like permease
LSRLKADLLLLLVALIWGGAFVAQKDVLAHIGSFTFVAARFALSALLVLPLAWREQRQANQAGASIARRTAGDLVLLCVAFAVAVLAQQGGIEKTSITNAGFLTGLYVLFVPVICRVLYRERLSALIFPAALLSVIGVFLLSGGTMTSLSSGDMLVLLCAGGFALQVTLVGRIMARVKAPFRLCFIQYAAVAAVSGIGALVFEHPAPENILQAWGPIIYAGAISGGIAYTLQVVAQQYTPAADSAVILSGEAVFAAFAAALLNGERLTGLGALGCGLIILAILMVEFGPFLLMRLREHQGPPKAEKP